MYSYFCSMLYRKLETSSERVNGLCFHCKRPWILASLDSGSIQLWDYNCKTIIQQFHGHEGPVRGVHFHNNQPLFVSGGDDYTIKVWNYELQRCSFTLLGHLGCIRTVQFHHECPWILSASEDYTVRIWDWQSGTCLSVLKYHRYFVTCASFHPREDLVLSASLDHTVLIWDISALRKENSSPSSPRGAFVRNVVDDFKMGVYWASFHPTHNYAVAVDDLCLRLYKMSGNRFEQKKSSFATEDNRISCVLFPKQDGIMISCSGNKNIKVWFTDYYNIIGKYHIATEHDRLWIIASHPGMNLLAAGHDCGMVLFKLERERPAFSVSGDNLFYVKGGQFLHMYKYSTQKDTELIQIRHSTVHSKALNRDPRTLLYSRSDNAILICSDEYGGYYQLYTGNAATGDTVRISKWGSGRSAVFIGKNRFAVLMQTNQVLVKNLNNETVQESPLPSATYGIIYAGSGNLLCRGDDRVYIFDFQQRIVLASLQTSFIKYVVWTCDMERVALLCKQSILIVDKNLMHHCTIHETRIKSGAWDDSGEVFIYTTHTHIKFCLPDGDCGIIKSLGVAMYVTKVYGNTIFCLDREGKNYPFVIDSTEYIFKLSLLRNRHDQVMSMIRNNPEKLYDNKAMIAYLQQKYPEVALCLVKDEHARFNLALEIGNIKMALESVNKIDDKDYWFRLAVEALKHGNAGVAEYAYQKTQNFERLSFLYLITGNLDKLIKMMKIVEVKNAIMSQFHNALYLGDVCERVKVLESVDHLPLAYITAAVHDLNDSAERLAKELGGNVPSMPKGKKASLLLPPTPILAGGDWPLQKKGISEDGLSTSVLEGSLSRLRTRIKLTDSQKSIHLYRRKIKKRADIL